MSFRGASVALPDPQDSLVSTARLGGPPPNLLHSSASLSSSLDSLVGLIDATRTPQDRFLDLSLPPWFWPRVVERSGELVVFGFRGVLGLPPLVWDVNAPAHFLGEFSAWACAASPSPPTVFAGPTPLLLSGSPSLWRVTASPPRDDPAPVARALRVDGVANIGVFVAGSRHVVTGVLPSPERLFVVALPDIVSKELTPLPASPPVLPAGFTPLAVCDLGVVALSPSGVLVAVFP